MFVIVHDHLQKYFSLCAKIIAKTGKSHSFIVDTSSIESIIPKWNLFFLYNDAHLKPTSRTITGITGHRLPTIGTANITLRKRGSGCVNIPFLVSGYGSPVFGLKRLGLLGVRTSLRIDFSDTTLIKVLVLQC